MTRAQESPSTLSEQLHSAVGPRNLCHEGDAWVHDVPQVYGPGAVVRDNARILREAWVLGRVEDYAQVCDLSIVAAGAYVGAYTVVMRSDAIARMAPPVPQPVTGLWRAALG